LEQRNKASSNIVLATVHVASRDVMCGVARIT
jgi:hypothetical protein